MSTLFADPDSPLVSHILDTGVKTALEALTAIYSEAGVDIPLPEAKELRERLLKKLTGESTQESKAGTGGLLEGTPVKNKSGPGWHDSETGKPVPGPKIGTADLPKHKDGSFPKSEDLHYAATDPLIEKALRRKVAPKDLAKYDALMGKLRAEHEASQKHERPEEPAKDKSAIERDILRINREKTDKRSAISPFIPAIYDELKKTYPDLTDKEFHAILDDMAKRDLLVRQTFGGMDIEKETGHAFERFPQNQRGQTVANIQAQPGAEERLAKSTTGTPEQHQTAVLSAFTKLDKSGDNLVSLADLRDELNANGVPDRAAQDAAITSLLRADKVRPSGIEGRHALSDPERMKKEIAAALTQGDRQIGYLSLRK